MLKVVICSGILFGYYWLFLRNKIFHRYNRFYLLSAIVVSVLLPFVKISFWQPAEQQNQVIRVLQAVSAGDEYMDNIIVAANPGGWAVKDLYPIAYLLISVCMLIVMLRTLLLIHSLLKKYPMQVVDQVSFINTDDKSTPFSFFRYIFWNSSIDLQTVTGKQIFKHEVAHIQERHTHDKLFLNLLLICFWCNPFFWFYRKELNMIHEFIADQKAVEDSDTASFAAMILQAAYPRHKFELTNNFFYSPIKRRLLMLTKNTNPRVNYIGRIMVLPLALLIFAAFTFKNKPSDKSAGIAYGDYTIIENPHTESDTIPAGIFINTRHADSAYLKSEEFRSKALVCVDSKIIGNQGNNYLENAAGKYSSAVIYNPVEATKIFGEQGRYGAISLTQKDLVFLNADSVFYDDKDKKIRLSGTSTSLKGDLGSSIIYIDGRLATPEELNLIPADRISTINILKGDKLEGVVDAKGKTALIQVNLKPTDLDEVVVTGRPMEKELSYATTLDKMNELYIGIENPLTISVPDVPSNQLLVQIDNGGTITGSNGKYIARVSRPGEITIRVLTIKNQRKVLLLSKTFQAKYLTEVTLGQMSQEYDATRNRLDSATQLLRKQQSQLMLQDQQKLELAQKLYKSELAPVKQEAEALQLSTGKKSLEAITVAGKKMSDQQLNSLRMKVEANQLDKAKQSLLKKTEGELLEQSQLTLKQNAVAGQLSKMKAAYLEDKLASIAYDSSLTLYRKQETELLAQRNNPIFTKTDINPSFSGGTDAWKKYLSGNLNASIPEKEGWKPGKYTILVSFIVNIDGTVSDVTARNYAGTKTAQHCIEIIQHAPKWLPAIQNGKKVNAYKIQPITFVVGPQ